MKLDRKIHSQYLRRIDIRYIYKLDKTTLDLDFCQKDGLRDDDGGREMIIFIVVSTELKLN